MLHSYEELRAIALDILAKREIIPYPLEQFDQLRSGIGYILARRENRYDPVKYANYSYSLDEQDDLLFLELFWDLFRQGIITLGLNNSNREFPFFRLTELGNKLAIDGSAMYFFHDVSSYEAAITKEIPHIRAATIIYLKEAMQAFRSGCLLSSTVMLGVAAEHTFMLLVETLEKNTKYNTTFTPIFKERTVLQKFNKFRNILDNQIRLLPQAIREDLDTHLSGVLSILRNFRNHAGHPTGIIMEREQIFVLLQLFIPYCKKQYQLIEYFK